MPLGLWKSKWEIHREDMDRYREDVERHRGETARRDVEYREATARRDAECREDRARSESEWRDLRQRSDELRGDYNRELEETRRFNRELLIRLDKTYANLTVTLALVADELAEVKLAVRAQTEAIMKLVDRFDEFEGRPPGRAA
jgi:chromosome segregation ATPase